MSETPIERLHRMREESLVGGGEKRIQAQHDKGKLTARERIDFLVDEGSFVELDRFVTHRCTRFGMQEQQILGDGVVTGHALISGRPVYLYSQDFTVFGGSLSETQSEKICKVMDLATKAGVPVIGLCDSGGARIQEGVQSLGGYAEIFWRNTRASGVVPQLSCVMGPCAGGAVYSPAITDFILMVEGTSYMHITGPDVVKTVTHEEVTSEELGGAAVHCEKSGVAHFSSPDDKSCMNLARRLLSYLPLNNAEEPPFIPTDDPSDRSEAELDSLVPEDPQKPYDVKRVIEERTGETITSAVAEELVFDADEDGSGAITIDELITAIEMISSDEVAEMEKTELHRGMQAIVGAKAMRELKEESSSKRSS